MSFPYSFSFTACFGIRSVLISLLIWNTSQLVTSQAVEQKSVTPENMAKEIKKSAQELAASDSLTIKKPIFEFDRVKKEIMYYLGSVNVGLLGLDSEDPYILAFQRQIQTEALRKLFMQVIPDENFWKPILTRSDELVASTVNDIETAANTSDMRRKLEQREEQFSSLFGEMHQAIRLFAQGKGYSARRVGDRVIASDSFTVRIVKNPPGGKVEILPYVKYIQCSALKKCGDNWPWRELVSEDDKLIGEYYYQAEWAGGRKNSGRIEVRSNTTLTFSPRE